MSSLPVWGQDADRAAVGGKSLVKLRHPTADAGLALYEVHVKAHIGQIQGSLNALIELTHRSSQPGKNKAELASLAQL